METVRPCGCKGIRTCLVCEKAFDIAKPDLYSQLKNYPSYVYCPECDKAYPGWDVDIYKQHPNHSGDPVCYPGVFIKLNFLSDDESTILMKDLDDLPWEISQSGRRKQNFGPKCNFKKRRLRLGGFNGFPKSTKFVQEKFKDLPHFDGFQTIEQCSLEYTADKGSSIDPHIDDCWIWGERIVTVNVTGDSVLTMTPYLGPQTRYNLVDTSDYEANWSRGRVLEDSGCPLPPENSVIRLPMPAKSLMILYSDARYKWEHCVLREDVASRRVCIAYREFTPPYLPSGKHYNEAEEILERAENFW